MTLTYNETRLLIEVVFMANRQKARAALRAVLIQLKRNEPQFYEGVIQHGPSMKLTSDQWLDLHQKIPHWRLRTEKALMDKLSPIQLQILGIPEKD